MFRKPDLDVNEFIRRFEGLAVKSMPSGRRSWRRSGSVLACPWPTWLGHGTLCHCLRRKSGRRVRSPPWRCPFVLKYIANDRATQQGLDKIVQTVRGTKKRRTWHPARSMWPLCVPRRTTSSTERGSCHRSIRQLRPGGRLVVIDLIYQGPQRSRPGTSTCPRESTREIEAVGFGESRRSTRSI